MFSMRPTTWTAKRGCKEALRNDAGQRSRGERLGFKGFNYSEATLSDVQTFSRRQSKISDCEAADAEKVVQVKM